MQPPNLGAKGNASRCLGGHKAWANDSDSHDLLVCRSTLSLLPASLSEPLPPGPAVFAASPHLPGPEPGALPAMGSALPQGDPPQLCAQRRSSQPWHPRARPRHVGEHRPGLPVLPAGGRPGIEPLQPRNCHFQLPNAGNCDHRPCQ